jgi:hypothetical protein
MGNLRVGPLCFVQIWAVKRRNHEKPHRKRPFGLAVGAKFELWR